MLAMPLASQAKIVLPDLVGSNMVLQQQTSATLWGKATPGSTIKVKADWTDQVFTTITKSDSTWTVGVLTPQASFTKHNITITETDGKSHKTTDNATLSNVLIGEVWYAGGQSNMEMPLNGFDNCPVKDANEEIATSGEWADKIRMAVVPRVGKDQPQEWVSGCKWLIPSPDTSPNMSAVAWFYAKMMERALQVPVGILTVAWGGSSVEGWTPREILNTYPDVNLEKDLKEGWKGTYYYYKTPLVMYNGQLHPVRHYTIKGFIWYQGESNVGKSTYYDRMKTMIKVFRHEFGDEQAKLPFYITEIAPWGGYGPSTSAATLRSDQHRLGETVPNCGCICINDLVEPYEVGQIHPREKRQVGYRLAYMALNKTYGIKGISTEYPEYDHCTVNDSTIEVFFKHAESGLSPLQDIRGFEVAGADGKYYPATATVNRHTKTVIVSSPQVAQPRNVRYGYEAFMPGNLHGGRELPVIPFTSEK